MKPVSVFDFRIDHSLKAKRGDVDRNSNMNGSVTVPASLFADDDTELKEDPDKQKKNSANYGQRALEIRIICFV